MLIDQDVIVVFVVLSRLFELLITCSAKKWCLKSYMRDGPKNLDHISIKIGQHLLNICTKVFWCAFLCPHSV